MITQFSTIHWFRQDLRVKDNPAFHAAQSKGSLLALYHYEEDLLQNDQLGAASKVWLHHSLASLQQDLDNRLCITRGNALNQLKRLIDRYQIKRVCWNHCVEPWRIEQDHQIQVELEAMGIEVSLFNGSYLWTQDEITKDDGTPYKVFTPYYRKGCMNATSPREPIAAPTLDLIDASEHTVTIHDLALLPSKSWNHSIQKEWEIGEAGAHEKLKTFTEIGIANYKEGRNFPADPYVSRLSPHLHWGEISPNQAWYAVAQKASEKNVDHFRSELGWREFSAYLLHHNPTLQHTNLQTKFNRFPWEKNYQHLRHWQQGKTGIPIVDAGMRELWQTGYMHNRVRMIVGSFLVKNLLLDWKLGEAWFRDCLVDADHANNSASWQWVAGCGADAAPYFRIFNPISQGKKFDPNGSYTKKYVPELKRIPNEFLFNPWEAPALVLKEANITLGENYPLPIIDLKQSREKALTAFASLKQESHGTS
jgi:deoxyribodipyrimidine photo-lyase